MNPSTSNQRKNFLIEPVLQKKIIWHFFVLGLIMTILNTLGFFFLMNKIVGYFEKAQEVNPELMALLQSTWTLVTVTTVFLSVVAIFGFSLYGLYFSNRIAGPIYHMRKCIGRIMSGEKGVRLSFRENDYFPELATEMNQLIDQQIEKN